MEGEAQMNLAICQEMRSAALCQISMNLDSEVS